ncbi:F-box protein SKIP28 isoform X2 [Ziziphus jujuba]|uniref:F-box protein SKIP28 isoform X2 n=1 Tax=Ziziphus jujuba TaxID=326968 RepID=A0A6P4B997_ZIZJJ|nr:F-box protein SKIP28 isoform X2 [Ziziphus jujuba]
MEISQTLLDESKHKEAILPSSSPSSGSGSIMEFTAQEGKQGEPHEALFLVLAYLPLFELLSMNKVCMSLRDAVKNDVLPWLNIVVQRPLNYRLTDEILMEITAKANGKLTTLALINCVKITDDALQRIVERNPLIDKLYIPACTGLTPEGVIRAVKTLSKNGHKLKNLWINGIYNIKREHFETLCSYLQLNLAQQEQQQPKPLLFNNYQKFPALGDSKNQPVIDMGVCPRCKEVSMVFDCPRKKTCKLKIERLLTDCRGCKLCIPRCQECGRCVVSDEVEEAVCADILCSDCWLQLPKCNLCNKPYCKQHANEKFCSSGSAGFVCDACQAKFLGKMCYYHIED